MENNVWIVVYVLCAQLTPQHILVFVFIFPGFCTAALIKEL